MPADIDVRPVRHRDVRTAGRVLARAFFDDPVMTWMVPGSGTYLEATKPELPAYYMRFGFEVTGELQLPNGGPKMWPMWRQPR